LAFKAGMQSFVSTPIEPETLRETLSQIFNQMSSRQKKVAIEAPKVKDFDREAALNRTMNDEELLKTMLDSALHSIQNEIALINSFLDKKDFDQIKQSAHKIKGIARNLSFERMAKIASDLEQAPSDSSQTIREYLQDMNEAFVQLKSVIVK
jgi:HPt (histidine-containing phosphotransfer) domain-containing protein